MGRVFLDLAVSIDGFIAGPGGQDGGLHDWYFAEQGAAETIKQELLGRIGAIILGHTAFGTAPDGFDTPYRVPHFILTHTPLPTTERDGASFTFVTGGLQRALEQARAAAGERDICVAGGSDVAGQFLSAGLLDELQLHLVPVVLGSGLPLSGPLGQHIRLEHLRTVESAHATSDLPRKETLSMAHLVMSEFLSLDGVMEEPSWTAAYWNDQIAAFKAAEMTGTDALLLGRRTYEAFAQAWPSRTDEESGGARMNALPKYVASTTLKQAEWQNTTVLGPDVAAEVAALKAQPGGDLLMYGSGVLGRFLLERGLVDQLNLLVYPVVLGRGQRLFTDLAVSLQLTESRPIGSGVVLMQYRPSTP